MVIEALLFQVLLVALVISLEPPKTRWVTLDQLKGPNDPHTLSLPRLALTHRTLRSSHQIEVASFLHLYRITYPGMVVHSLATVDHTAMPLVFPTTFLAPRPLSHPHIYRKRATPSLLLHPIVFIRGLPLLVRHSGQANICQQVLLHRSGNMRILEIRQ